jgi:diguanylate cyclase (GGDEF)-like protein
MEFVNKLPASSLFNDEDLEVCLAMASMVSVAIGNARSFHQAITDRLTNLYNFGYYQDRCPQELALARRHNQPLSIVMMDVDHFKAYNDRNGHEAGNQALVEVAAILQANSREGDIVARYGGEEFVVLLPSTAKREANRFAERVRAAIVARDFADADQQPLGRFTVSLGAATFPEDGDTDVVLLHAADQSLQRAKHSGRNRVDGAPS